MRPVLRAGLGLLLGLGLGPGACDLGCTDEVLGEVPSPDGRLRAVLFDRNCGATTASSVQVSVLPRAARPHGGGNVFVADAGDGGPFAAPDGGPPVTVHWAAPDSLVVTYPARWRVFRWEVRRGNVRVGYVRR